MTKDEALILIREFTDYGGSVDAEGLAQALEEQHQRKLARLHPIASEQTEDLARPLSDKP